MLTCIFGGAFQIFSSLFSSLSFLLLSVERVKFVFLVGVFMFWSEGGTILWVGELTFWSGEGAFL